MASPRYTRAILARSSAMRSRTLRSSRSCPRSARPAAQAPVWQTFLSELDRGQAALQAMASAAQAGARGQLRALEATAAGVINEPFAYASAHGLGCASG